jgi:hypothetical protein
VYDRIALSICTLSVYSANAAVDDLRKRNAVEIRSSRHVLQIPQAVVTYIVVRFVAVCFYPAPWSQQQKRFMILLLPAVCGTALDGFHHRGNGRYYPTTTKMTLYCFLDVHAAVTVWASCVVILLALIAAIFFRSLIW